MRNGEARLLRGEMQPNVSFFQDDLMRHGIALTVLAVVGASAGLASAATYHYADDFARTGNLNGSSPTTSVPAATWVR